MFSLICARINGWVNNREARDWDAIAPIMTSLQWKNTTHVMTLVKAHIMQWIGASIYFFQCYSFHLLWWCDPPEYNSLWPNDIIMSGIRFNTALGSGCGGTESLPERILTHWPLGNLNEILDMWFSKEFQWLMVEASLVKLSKYECHWMKSQHWFR